MFYFKFPGPTPPDQIVMKMSKSAPLLYNITKPGEVLYQEYRKKMKNFSVVLDIKNKNYFETHFDELSVRNIDRFGKTRSEKLQYYCSKSMPNS